MTDVPRENPTFASLYPDACVPAGKLHQFIGASRIAVLPFIIKSGELFEPRQVMDTASEIHEQGNRWSFSFNEVAGALIEHAQKTSPRAKEAAEEQVDQFFADRPTPTFDRNSFLEDAKNNLPERIFKQVEAAYESFSDERPAPIIGHIPRKS